MCGKDLTITNPNGQQQILCDLKNEGGLQKALDILPLLTEETYLKAYPEERKAQAFLEFCADGDVQAVVDLLNDYEDDDEEDPFKHEGKGDHIDILLYQDQIRTMSSGLHVAVQNQRIEVAWLILLLASKLEESHFPQVVLQAAEHYGVRREDQIGRADIRTLQDAEGKTAEQRAAEMGGVWAEWITSGRLKPPNS